MTHVGNDRPPTLFQELSEAHSVLPAADNVRSQNGESKDFEELYCWLRLTA